MFMVGCQGSNTVIRFVPATSSVDPNPGSVEKFAPEQHFGCSCSVCQLALRASEVRHCKCIRSVPQMHWLCTTT